MQITDIDTVANQPKQSFALETDLITSSAEMFGEYPKKVMFNPYNVAQMKKVVYAPDNASYYKILASVMQELVDVNVYDLTVLDFDKLLWAVRVNTVGPKVNYHIRCGKCQQLSPCYLDLTTFSLNPLPKGFKESRAINKDVLLHLPRVGAFIEQREMDEEDITPIDHHAGYIQASSFKESLEIFDGLDPVAIPTIHKYVKEVDKYGIDAGYEFNCAGFTDEAKTVPCGAVEQLRVAFRHTFFLPDIV